MCAPAVRLGVLGVAPCFLFFATNAVVGGLPVVTGRCFVMDSRLEMNRGCASVAALAIDLLVRFFTVPFGRSHTAGWARRDALLGGMPLPSFAILRGWEPWYEQKSSRHDTARKMTEGIAGMTKVPTRCIKRSDAGASGGRLAVLPAKAH